MRPALAIAFATLASLTFPARVLRAQTQPPAARDTAVAYVAAAAADSVFLAIASAGPIFRAIPTGSASYQYLVATRHETGDAELHERWADVAIVRSGTAVLRTGPALERARQVEPHEWHGAGIVGARDRKVGPGDVVVIPAGVAHQWRPSPGAPFSYVTVKVAR